jgi:hypothetical protein
MTQVEDQGEEKRRRNRDGWFVKTFHNQEGKRDRN